MAIGDIYNSLTFGGVNSLDYGVYISGPGVFDAPTRDVELVSIPGRNGAIEIDQGHWNNIEVRYVAGTFGDDQADFAKNVNAFRNAIVSQLGYQRLTDTYNPDEYRLGLYSSGLDVSAVNYNKAGEFELVFNCKPQRFLIEGEDTIEVASGDTLTNPTLYESGPIIISEGFGTIRLGDNEISISDETYGEISLESLIVGDNTFEIDTTLLNVGDEIRFPQISQWQIGLGAEYTINAKEGYQFKTAQGDFVKSFTRQSFVSYAEGGSSWAFNYGTQSSQGFTFAAPSVQLDIRNTSGQSVGVVQTYLDIKATYDGNKTFSLEFDFYSYQPQFDSCCVVSDTRALVQSISANSTKLVASGVVYIDLEIGNAYKIEGGEYIDLNKYIELPSDLPKLKPGNNAVTLDNTFTKVEIVPRWWEL